MNNMMTFPKTIDEFIESYQFVDRKEVYTNGSELIPVFRVQQAIEHYLPKWISVKERLPEEDGASIIALIQGVRLFYAEIANYNAARRTFINDDGIERGIEDAVYWMLLPEPPEVEG